MYSMCKKKQASYLVVIQVVSAIIISGFFAYTAYAYEDVPPAVPVNSVKTEALTLSEPYKMSKQESGNSVEIEQQDTAENNSSPPNFFERLWSKISSNIAAQDKEKLKEKTQNKIKKEKEETEDYLAQPLKPVILQDNVFYVLELFTTQACPFCPKADAMMEAYANRPDVIALSCHVDYFDVQQGSLSQPICSSRQMRYEASFKGTPKYTPQMVINGGYDAVGYLPDKITQAFEKAQEHPVRSLEVSPVKETNFYHVILPDYDEGRYHIWLVSYNQPHLLKIQDGANAGRDIVYYNVVSKAEFLGSWDGHSKGFEFEVKLLKQAKGFTVFVQEVETGSILMASKNEI